MPSKKEPPRQVPAHTRKAADIVAHNASFFRPRADLSNRVFTEIVLEGADVRQAKIAGAIFRDSIFTNCSFNRADFEAFAAESTSFIGVDFSSSDLRSCHFANCVFEDCNFESASIDDCSFSSSHFSGCEFESVNFTSSNLLECHLDDVAIPNSTVLHNMFVDTTFNNVSFGDSSFYYHIFDKCCFSGASMNVESVAFTFGLTSRDLSAIQLLYQDNNIEHPGDGGILENIINEYDRRSWAIHARFASLNCSDRSLCLTLLEVMDALISDIAAGKMVKRDDFIFFKRIVDFLGERRRLPLFSVVKMVDQVAALLRSDAPRHGTTVQIRQQLLLFHNQMVVHAHAMVEDFHLAFREFFEMKHDADLVQDIIFLVKPNIDVVYVMNHLAAAQGIPGSAWRIESRHGSFIEKVSCAWKVALSLFMFLYITEACIVRLTLIRERVEVLVSPNLPEAYRLNALEPRLTAVPAELTSAFQAILSGVTRANIKTFTERTGLDKENVIGVRIHGESRHQ